MSGHWHSPLYALGQVLCSNWSGTFGISALPFSGIDVAGFVLLVRAALSADRARLAAPLRSAAAAFFATVVLLAAAGAVRGGSADAAYWQVRQLAWMPGLIWLSAHALDGESGFLRLSQVIVAAALVKSAVGLWFHFFVALPRGIDSPVILSHSETLLLCLAVALLATRWLERPDAASLRRCLLFLPPILAAIWLNNRRIAWVGLTASAALIWNFARWNAGKRALARGALF